MSAPNTGAHYRLHRDGRSDTGRPDTAAPNWPHVGKHSGRSRPVEPAPKHPHPPKKNQLDTHSKRRSETYNPRSKPPSERPQAYRGFDIITLAPSQRRHRKLNHAETYASAKPASTPTSRTAHATGALKRERLPIQLSFLPFSFCCLLLPFACTCLLVLATRCRRFDARVVRSTLQLHFIVNRVFH